MGKPTLCKFFPSVCILLYLRNMMALEMLDCYLMDSVLASKVPHSPNTHFAVRMEVAEECDSDQSQAVCGAVYHFPHSPDRPLSPPVPSDPDQPGPAPNPASSFAHKWLSQPPQPTPTQVPGQPRQGWECMSEGLVGPPSALGVSVPPLQCEPLYMNAFLQSCLP